MHIRTMWFKGLSLGMATTMVFAGCGNLVVKVQKKPKDVNLASLENFSSLNLTSAEDFLKQLDSLKVIGIDLIIKEIASKNYRQEVRSAIRTYRKHLIEKGTSVGAEGPYGGSENAFYYSKDECRKIGLSFNLDQAHGALGLILKTGVLAKISEVAAGKLNPGFQGASKQLAAVAQLVLMELGIKVSGDVDVKEENGQSVTSGSFTLQLTEIKGENLDEKTKQEDATQILGIGFKRALGANTEEAFDAAIQVVNKNATGTLETLAADFKIRRVAANSLFVHEAQFNVGVKGKSSSYMRKMKFEQLPDDKKQLKITDTFQTAGAKAETYITTLNIEKGNQCKFQVGSAGGGGKGGAGDKVYGPQDPTKGGEGPFAPTPPTVTPSGDGKEPGPTPPAKPVGTSTATGTKVTTGTATGTSTGKGTPPTTPPTDNDGKSNPPPGGPNKPGQSPTQNPTQSK